MTLEEMIREMVKNGMTTEDVARQTQDTLNSIEKVEKEKREKEKAIKEDRKNYLDILKREFNDNFTEKRFTTRDVGILAALVVAPDYPNWTVDDIKEFIKDVAKGLEMQAKLVGLFKKDFSSVVDRMTCSGCKQEKRDYDRPSDPFLNFMMGYIW